MTKSQKKSVFGVLDSVQAVKKLEEDRKELRAVLAASRKAKRAAVAKARRLKAKALTTSMQDALELLKMKAAQLSETTAASSSDGEAASSSSSTAWKPKDAKEAFEFIEQHMTSPEPTGFGEYLRKVGKM